MSNTTIICTPCCDINVLTFYNFCLGFNVEAVYYEYCNDYYMPYETNDTKRLVHSESVCGSSDI